MGEYIERETVENAIAAVAMLVKETASPKSALDIALNAICNIPAADVAPVRHGRWEAVGADKRGRGAIYRCSDCKHTYPYVCDYCPNCGAKMDGGAANETAEE